jgi:hypothetical protein
MSELKGTFIWKIPRLWIGHCQTRTLFSPVSRSQPNARSQHGRTSVFSENVLQLGQPRLARSSRKRTAIQILPGGTQNVSPNTQPEIKILIEGFFYNWLYCSALPMRTNPIPANRSSITGNN